MLDWEPGTGFRAWGRPVLTWEDTLRQFAKTKGETWQVAAKDRDKWALWEDEFAMLRW